jgi:hypothetical protein
MINMTENELRDYIFDNYSEYDSFNKIIIDNKELDEWNEDSFPPLSFLIKRMVETKINNTLNELVTLELDGKEIPLFRENDSTSRIDLIGRTSGAKGLTIIELKKSQQTERQSFTELLGYSNYFCNIFPGLNDKFITSVLIAPMETRIVRDALFQELLINNNKIISLMPVQSYDNIKLRPYYPNEGYYKYFENKILSDSGFSCISVEISNIDGYLDTKEVHGSPRQSNINILNNITSMITQKMESHGISGFAYSKQYWEDVAIKMQNPNIITIVFMNPFNIENGNSEFINKTINKLKIQKDEWKSSIEIDYHSLISEIIRDIMKKSFMNSIDTKVNYELSYPFWCNIKNSALESACVHHHNIYTTGLIRDIYLEYIEHIYKNKYDEIHYGDDLHAFAYSTYNKFFPVWRIISGLSNVENY